jgi:hypothetical protein
MHIGRTILTFLVASSLALLPMGRAFVASGDEAMASEVGVASAHEGCDHAAMASDVVAPSAHECCDHEAMATDHAMNGCPASADCIAKCSSLYAVLFSKEAIPSPIARTEPHFLSNPFCSQTTSPPYRPPRA